LTHKKKNYVRYALQEEKTSVNVFKKNYINAGGFFRHTEEKYWNFFQIRTARVEKTGMHWEIFDELSRF